MVDPRPHKPSFVSSILTSTTLRPASVMDAHKSSKLVDQVRFLGGLLMNIWILEERDNNGLWTAVRSFEAIYPISLQSMLIKWEVGVHERVRPGTSRDASDLLDKVLR